MKTPDTSSAAADWARLLVVLGARTYRNLLVTLTVIAVAPLALGWASYVVRSGSMEPSLSVGDVTVTRALDADDKVEVGRIFVFEDPAPGPERTLVHRIVELRDDGDYTTAGDANPLTDVTPLPRAQVDSQTVLLVPWIGLPVVWVQAGQWTRLALWLLLSVAAMIVAGRDLGGEPPKRGTLRLLRDGGHGGRSEESPPRGSRETVSSSRRSVAPVLVAGLGLVLLGGTSTAGATFTARAESSGNYWRAGEVFQPYLAAVLADRPYGFWLLDEPAGAQLAQDRTGRSPARYRPGATLGQPGGLPGNPGTSMRTSGGVALTAAVAVRPPVAHSTELWFRTSSRAGGYLVGFGDSTSAAPSLDDRVLRMAETGQLTYGSWDTNPRRVLTTPHAYNDGSWHHVVVSSSTRNSSFQDTTIHVDGVQVTAGDTSQVQTWAPGYWRVAGGSGGPPFDGLVDNVSIYHIELSAQRVAAHWAAR